MKTKDFLVTGESFDLYLDCDKEMLYTSPKPDAENLQKYYESSEYISHNDKSKGIVSNLYRIVKKFTLQKKLRLIYNQNHGLGSLLDVGAGTGDFLLAAKKKGWKVAGVEPNIVASKLASEKGIPLKNSLDDFEKNQFDVVTLWHVLEHIQDLDTTVLFLSNLVKPNGTLIIAVPNFKSYDAKHYGKYWAAYDVPRHLWHFSKKSIESLFFQNFHLEKTKPMIFDSFYVSLLSEKYQSGNSFSLKAIWIGLMSNLKGIRSNQYSSHIYLLKRRD